MKSTKIEWTDKTWNPITGCSKKSTGCLHCYAEVMSRRLKAMGLEKYANGFEVTLHEDCIREPLTWKKGHNIFVCSKSDIFHEDVPFEFVDKMFDVIKATPHHRYQILTKRAERLAEYFLCREIPENVWLGVTVEAKSSKFRIDMIRDLDASVKFLSCEPLVEDLGELDLSGIDLVIVGGESGPKARPMQEEWVMNIRKQVEEQGSKFFFKQWGTWVQMELSAINMQMGKNFRDKLSKKCPDTLLIYLSTYTKGISASTNLMIAE